MFRNSIGGQRDMFLLGTTDGEKFSAGKKLGKGSWKLDACPMDGGMLASDGKEQLVTVWQRQNQVFATLGNGQVEKPLGAGQQAWIAACTCQRFSSTQVLVLPRNLIFARGSDAEDPQAVVQHSNHPDAERRPGPCPGDGAGRVARFRVRSSALGVRSRLRARSLSLQRSRPGAVTPHPRVAA